MYTIDDIKTWNYEQKKQFAETLRPLIYDYLERIGYNAGTAARPRNIPCPICGKGTRTACASISNKTYYLKCFSCGAAADVVSISQQLHSSSFTDALIDVYNTVGGSAPLPSAALPVTDKAPTQTEPEAPSADWIDRTEDYINACYHNLWSTDGSTARAYLMNTRGLKERTLKKFCVGYDKYKDGITIPTYVPLHDPVYCTNPIPMRVKLRRLHPKEGESKYQCRAGSKASAPFNGSALLHDPFVVMPEGEIDAMTIWQEGIDVAAPVTFGAASTTPDAVIWRDWLKCPDIICICGDNDDPGNKADAELYSSVLRLKNIRGAERTDDLHVFRAALPGGCKDWNEYYTGGGNIESLLDSFFTGKG